jgi:hypothetical protein
MNALQTLTVLPLTADERRNFVNQAIDEITSGDRNPIEAHLLLNSLEKLVAEIKKAEPVKEAVIRELTKYGQKTVDFGRFEIQLSERKSYDYQQCSDSEWEMMDAEIRTLTEKKKAREAMLQNLVEPVGNIETGEYIYPASFTTTEIITVKEKKGVKNG